jgi:hypothetical protein
MGAPSEPDFAPSNGATEVTVLCVAAWMPRPPERQHGRWDRAWRHSAALSPIFMGAPPEPDSAPSNGATETTVLCVAARMPRARAAGWARGIALGGTRPHFFQFQGRFAGTRRRAEQRSDGGHGVVCGGVDAASARAAAMPRTIQFGGGTGGAGPTCARTNPGKNESPGCDCDSFFRDPFGRKRRFAPPAELRSVSSVALCLSVFLLPVKAAPALAAVSETTASWRDDRQV